MSDRIVTIIIPTFNQNEHYLRAALLSAKHQTYPCEIVIVDDGSDPSQEDIVADVMEGYSHSVGVSCKYVYQENRGVAGALNRGIEESTGSFIQWLPSDDLFSTKKTDKQLKYMIGGDYSVSYCSYEEGIPITANTWPAAQYPDKDKFFDSLKTHCFVNAATVMFRRSLVDECGMFNEDMVHAQDYEFLLRLAERYNFGALNEPLVRRRVHEGQMLRTLKNPEEKDKKQKDMDYIKERYGAEGHVWIPDIETEESSASV